MTLKVPNECIEAYKADSKWGIIKNISGLPDTYEDKKSGWQYSISYSNQTAQITGYNGDRTKVEIPTKVDFNGLELKVINVQSIEGGSINWLTLPDDVNITYSGDLLVKAPGVTLEVTTTEFDNISNIGSLIRSAVLVKVPEEKIEAFKMSYPDVKIFGDGANEENSDYDEETNTLQIAIDENTNINDIATIVNSGATIAENIIVTLDGDLDLTEIADEASQAWQQIGTEKNPLTGKLEGLGRKFFKVDPQVVELLERTPRDEFNDVIVHVWWSWDTEHRRLALADRDRSMLLLAHPVSRDVFMWPKYCPRFTVENCRGGRSLDDWINIHGNYLKVLSVNGSRVRLQTQHASQSGFFPYRPGDALEFVTAHERTVVARANVLSQTADPSDSRCCEVTVYADLSAAGVVGLLVENATLNPNVTIRGNRFADYPNLRLSGRGKYLIESNRFERCSSAVTGMDLADYWFESGRTQDVTIRGCKFTDLGIGGHSPQAILQVDPIIPKEARGTDWFFHNSIVFENNTICTFDRQVVYALSVEKIRIAGNKFIDSKSYAPIYPSLSVIDMQYCGDVTIEGNDFSQWQPDATISLHNCLEVKNDCSTLPTVNNPNPFFFQN